MKYNKLLNSISFVFPCYNEEENIPSLISEVVSIAPKVAKKYEIILVNDGSTDGTAKVIKEFASQNKNIRLVSQKNQGFGGALNTGFQAAKYDWVFYSDADLQFDLSEITKFIPYTSENDLVIGYRQNRAEGFKRIVYATGMKVLNTLYLGFPYHIKDIDCAFKLINKDVIKSVGPLVSKGNLVSTEFLLQAYNLGFSMHQIGVRHYVRLFGVSKCGSLKDVFVVVKELANLKSKIVKKHRLYRLGENYLSKAF
ncbi:MAG: glycosyltransferase family 2 protein [Patescibacteria group bacterium]